MFTDFGGGRGREREKHRLVISCLPYAPQLGIEPTTEVRALTGNGTHNLSKCMGQCCNQLSHPARATFHILEGKQNGVKSGLREDPA